MVDTRTGGLSSGSGETTLLVAPEADAAIELLAAEHPETALLVAAERSATAVLDAWRRAVGTVDDIVVVAVGESVRSAARSRPGRGPLGNAIRTVPDFADTDALVEVVTNALSDLGPRIGSPTVYVESLTAFERQVSLSRLVATVGALSNAIDAAEAEGHFLLDTDVGADTRRLLQMLVDRTVTFDDDRPTVIEGGEDKPAVGTVFSLLSSAERRFVLRRLEVADDDVSVGTLADELAAVMGFDERLRASTALYHTHLPPLADADVVSFDRDNGVVGPGASFECVRPYMRQARE